MTSKLLPIEGDINIKLELIKCIGINVGYFADYSAIVILSWCGNPFRNLLSLVDPRYIRLLDFLFDVVMRVLMKRGFVQVRHVGSCLTDSKFSLRMSDVALLASITLYRLLCLEAYFQVVQ